MFKRSVALIIVLSLCFSAASFAKKPIKLTDKEMDKIQGAIIPVALAVAAGPYVFAFSVAFTASALENMMRDDAEYRAAHPEVAEAENYLDNYDSSKYIMAGSRTMTGAELEEQRKVRLANYIISKKTVAGSKSFSDQGVNPDNWIDGGIGVVTEGVVGPFAKAKSVKLFDDVMPKVPAGLGQKGAIIRGGLSGTRSLFSGGVETIAKAPLNCIADYGLDTVYCYDGLGNYTFQEISDYYSNPVTYLAADWDAGKGYNAYLSREGKPSLLAGMISMEKKLWWVKDVAEAGHGLYQKSQLIYGQLELSPNTNGMCYVTDNNGPSKQISTGDGNRLVNDNQTQVSTIKLPASQIPGLKPSTSKYLGDIEKAIADCERMKDTLIKNTSNAQTADAIKKQYDQQISSLNKTLNDHLSANPPAPVYSSSSSSSKVTEVMKDGSKKTTVVNVDSNGLKTMSVSYTMMSSQVVNSSSGKSSSKSGSSGSSGGSSGSSSSSKGSGSSTASKPSSSTSSSSGKVGTMTTAVAQSAIAKASSGSFGSLTATEKAYLSNN